MNIFAIFYITKWLSIDHDSGKELTSRSRFKFDQLERSRELDNFALIIQTFVNVFSENYNLFTRFSVSFGLISDA